MSRISRTVLAVAAAIAVAAPAYAAEVTGVTVSPTTLDVQEGSSGSYDVAVTSIAGNIPATVNQPAITYCSAWTIHANGSVTCDQQLTILLQRGRNYTQVPLTAADILTLTRSVTINVDAGLCGQSFVVTDTLTLNSGSGTDFGTYGSSITRSVTVTVTCPSVPEGGCSHGYWKNHESVWQTPYTPGTVLGDVFAMGSAYSAISSNTFADALDFQGGPTVVDKARLLMLQAVASLLNAAQPLVNYPVSENELKAQVEDALASGDADQILTLKDALDGYNNLGSPVCGDQ